MCWVFQKVNQLEREGDLLVKVRDIRATGCAQQPEAGVAQDAGIQRWEKNDLYALLCEGQD